MAAGARRRVRAMNNQNETRPTMAPRCRRILGLDPIFFGESAEHSALISAHSKENDPRIPPKPSNPTRATLWLKRPQQLPAGSCPADPEANDSRARREIRQRRKESPLRASDTAPDQPERC